MSQGSWGVSYHSGDVLNDLIRKMMGLKLLNYIVLQIRSKNKINDETGGSRILIRMGLSMKRMKARPIPDKF